MTETKTKRAMQFRMPMALKRLFGGEFKTIHTVGLIVGLAEGIAISQYDIIMARLTVGALFHALLFVLAAGVTSLLVWSLLGLLFGRFVKSERWLIRSVTIVFALSVLLGRYLLADRTVDWGLRLWWIGLAAVLVFPFPERPSRWARLTPVVATLSALLMEAHALAGRVPDFSFTTFDAVWLYGTSATVAVVLYLMIRRTPLLLAPTLLLFLAIGLIPMLSPPVTGKPNVLFILVDTLRRDHVSVFGDQIASPAIDKLAREGVAFDDAITVIPKTSASVASIFTGMYPIHHGVRTLYDRLRPDRHTLAERFFEAGYHTAAFVNNAWLSSGRGFGQGFEQFFGYYEVNDTYGTARYNSWLTLIDGLTLRRIDKFTSQTSARRLTDATLAHLAAERETPFFVYVHYFEPHWPYIPPDRFAERYDAPVQGRCVVNFPERFGLDRGLMIFQNYLPEEENEKARRLYKAEADDTLEQVGRLIRGLDDLGLEKNTIVVLTADHGHSLDEHDYYFHHGEFVYDASLRIPLLMRWTGKLPAGRRVRQQVRTIDLSPTLHDLAGLTPADRFDGLSLMRYLSDPTADAPATLVESDINMFPANRRRALTGIAGKIRGLRTGTHKLILNPSHRGSRFELYDLVSDPAELRDIASAPQSKHLLSEMQQELLQMIPRQELQQLIQMGSAMTPADKPHQHIEHVAPSEKAQALDANEQEMLRNLGYIQ